MIDRRTAYQILWVVGVALAGGLALVCGILLVVLWVPLDWGR